MGPPLYVLPPPFFFLSGNPEITIYHLVDHLGFPVVLWMECRTQAQFYARHLKKIAPDMTSEHRVTVAGDRRGKPVEADDTVEEGPGHGRRRVGMTERDEVSILGEAVDHRENDRLAAHLGEALDEVHGDIRPDLRRHLQGLK